MSVNNSENDRNAWSRPGVEEVGDGVFRIPLPLPDIGLRAVNVYALTAGDAGVDLIDAGAATPESRAALQEALAHLGYRLDQIRTVSATHMHYDHYTLAVLLRREYAGMRISIGDREKSSLDHVARLRAGDEEPALERDLRQWGADDIADAIALEEATQTEFPDFSDMYDFPDTWLRDGLDVRAGRDRVLRVVGTPGHTRGHVMFQSPAAGIVFSGDHLLPHITPSIGFEPERNPLALQDYLQSLDKVLARPDGVLLPAHGPVTASAHERARELIAHHRARLQSTLDACTGLPEPAHVIAARLTWTRREKPFDQLTTFDQALAVAETHAHLSVLAERERIAVMPDGEFAAAGS